MNQVVRPRGCLLNCAISTSIKGSGICLQLTATAHILLALALEQVSPELVKMPRLLRAVLCIIEAFHKYARDDEDKNSLSCRELKQLLQGEIGDFLQPHVIHAVQRHLNLLDFNNASTVNFDEFVLAIFSLLNLCYLDIKSLLNSEPREVPKSEESNDVDLQENTRNDQLVVRTLPTQEKMLLPSRRASPSQIIHEESKAEHPWEGIETLNLQRDMLEPRDPKNQYTAGNEQSKGVAQDVPAMEDNRDQIKTNKLSGSEQTSSPAEHIPEEGANKTSDRFEEQEENLKVQQETMQKPPFPELVPENSINNHSKIQAPSLQGGEGPSSEHADVLEQAVTRKASQTQKSDNPKDDGKIMESPEPGKDETKDRNEPEDCGRTSETQKLPAQEREHEIRGPQVQGGSKDGSERPDIIAEGKENRGLETYGTAEQKEYTKKTQPPVAEAQTYHGKYQELQGSSKENDSDILNLITEERNQDYPETEGSSVPGEEMRHTEEDIAPAFVDSKNGPAAKGAQGSKDRTQESTPLDKQSERENNRVTEPIGEEDGNQKEDPEAPTAQHSKGSCTTLNDLAPEEGDSHPNTGELSAQGDFKNEAHPHKKSVQESQYNNPDIQKHEAPGENSRTQEPVVLLIREEDVCLLEEQEVPTGAYLKSYCTETKSPGGAVEPTRPLEVQKFTTKGKNRKPLEAEVPDGLDIDFTVTQLPVKEGSRKELKKQDPKSKEEDNGEPETQELLLSPGEDNSAFHKTYLEAEGPATLEKDDESPYEPAGESDEQQSQTKKKYDSSVPLPGLDAETEALFCTEGCDPIQCTIPEPARQNTAGQTGSSCL